MIRPLLWLPLLAVSALPAHAQDSDLRKQANKLHELAGGTWCNGPNRDWDPEDAYREWTLTYQPSWNDDAEAETVTLIRIFCMAGAYNVVHAYYTYTDMEGLRPIGFATPTYDVKYENDDFEGTVEGIKITGMQAEMTLVNSDFDPETQMLTSDAKWRGMGDASSSGTWVFDEGVFSLVRFEVDASYDGEVNPETLLDYTQ